MVRHTLKILQQMRQDFKNVYDLLHCEVKGNISDLKNP